MSLIHRAGLVYLNRKYFSLIIKRFSSAIPKDPIILESKKVSVDVKIDSKIIEHLERLSLVDFANLEGIRRLEEAIQFASLIHTVDTSNVEPMITVHQNEYLQAREDCVTEGDIREEILANAAVTEEEYFFAPPGNIPLPEKKDYSYEN